MEGVKRIFEERLDRLRILTTIPLAIKPDDRYYEHYRKYDVKGRPIVNSLRASCIPQRRDGAIGWSDHCISELKKLTDDWLQGDALGVTLRELVLRYKAGDKSFYDAIKLRMESKINYVITSQLGERHEVFTRLDGKSAKSPKRGRTVIPKPGDDEYGEGEEYQINAVYEERFTEADLQKLIDKSLADALRTYDPGKKTFKSWFGQVFKHDVINLQKDYKDDWKRKPKKANFEKYIEKLKESGRVWDFSILYNNYPEGCLNILDDAQLRLLNIRADAGTLYKKDEAAALGVGVSKRNDIQSELEKQYIEWFEKGKYKVKIIDRDKLPPIKSTFKKNPYKMVCSWAGKRIDINPDTRTKIINEFSREKMLKNRVYRYKYMRGEIIMKGACK